MAKMEIEFTEEQLEKVDILKKNGIEVGEAIDMLFEFKNEILTQTDEYIDKRITEANKQKAELEAQINEIDEEFLKDISKKDAVTYRRIFDFINELEMLGIISTNTISRGRGKGRTNIIKLQCDEDLLETTLYTI